MAFRVSAADFEEMVRQACEEVPAAFRGRLDNVVVRTRALPEPGQPRGLLGLYEGWPEPAHPGPGVDVITLYQHPIEEESWSLEDLRAEIRETLLHEIGHHFGMSEAELESVAYESARLAEAEADVAERWQRRDSSAIALYLVFPPLGLLLALDVRTWPRQDALISGALALLAAVVAAAIWNPAWLLGLVVPGPSVLVGAPAAVYLAWRRSEGGEPDHSSRRERSSR